MWIRVNWDRKCRDMGQELIIASRVDIFKNLYLIGEVISEGREKKDLTTSVKGRCFTCFFFCFFHFQDGASTPNTVWLCKERNKYFLHQMRVKRNTV